ncbi:MAG: tail fiber protein [Pirellulales bacterium]
MVEPQLPEHSHDLDWPCGSETGTTGGGLSHTNMQPSLGLNYVIALTGTFPSRNFTADDPSAAGLSLDPILGEVSLFAGNFAPRGWAFADGQLLSISQNQALFSILGTTYGGDGRTTFALPDFRGRSAVHPGTGPGLTPWSLGQRAGFEDVTLTEGQMPTHSHTAFTEPLPGDMDIDGNVDFDDIDAFQLGLNDPQGYEAIYCATSAFNGDMDQDGGHDFDDIAGFVVAINAPLTDGATAVPEPAALVLISMGLLALVGRRWR